MAVNSTRALAASCFFALLCATTPSAVPADPSATTLADRLMHTIYPERAIPSGYETPISSEPPGSNPRPVLYTFTRTADHAVTLLRFDLYDDDASLKKKYPTLWSRSGFDVAANPVIYRMGNYRANCSAHSNKIKAQVADVCEMVIGATVMSVETTFAVPPGISLDPKASSDPFLDSIRKTSTTFVANGASFYLAVSGLGP